MLIFNLKIITTFHNCTCVWYASALFWNLMHDRMFEYFLMFNLIIFFLQVRFINLLKFNSDLCVIDVGESWRVLWRAFQIYKYNYFFPSTQMPRSNRIKILFSLVDFYMYELKNIHVSCYRYVSFCCIKNSKWKWKKQ